VARKRPFAAIYGEYFDFVWTHARAFGVSPEAMDDVVQEIFLVIHDRLRTLEKPSALRSWIYGITRRVAGNHRRARRSREGSAAPPDAELDLEAEGPSPLEAAVRREDLALLRLLLSKLDPLKRQAFIMTELMEMTGAELAEAMNVPLNTAYSRVRLARAEFEQALAEHLAELKKN
jgi:RNA polymerase sigma-70 factor (ECF subfamily)